MRFLYAKLQFLRRLDLNDRREGFESQGSKAPCLHTKMVRVKRKGWRRRGQKSEGARGEQFSERRLAHTRNELLKGDVQKQGFHNRATLRKPRPMPASLASGTDSLPYSCQNIILLNVCLGE